MIAPATMIGRVPRRGTSPEPPIDPAMAMAAIGTYAAPARSAEKCSTSCM
jgi:hypothetical protein